MKCSILNVVPLRGDTPFQFSVTVFVIIDYAVSLTFTRSHYIATGHAEDLRHMNNTYKLL